MDPTSAGVMHAGPMAHALVAHPSLDGVHIPLALAVADPMLQQQAEIGRVSYDTDDHTTTEQQQIGSAARSSSALLGRKHAADRRPLRFWQPFNDWWRAELDRLGRRPTSHEIGDWYVQSADGVWGDSKPTLQETRVHAKCLRSLPLVRDYFRNYRAKKRGYKGDNDADEDGDTEDGADNNTSSRRIRRAKKQATPEEADSDMQAAMQGMAQLGAVEMMQMQAAGMMLPQQFWAGAMAAMEGQDADDYTRAIMLQQHLHAAMLQQQMAAAAVAAQQFTGQQFGVFPAQYDDDDDGTDTEPGDNQTAAAAAEPADGGNPEVASGLAAGLTRVGSQLENGGIAGASSQPSGLDRLASGAIATVAEDAQAQQLLQQEGGPAAAVPQPAAAVVGNMLLEQEPAAAFADSAGVEAQQLKHAAGTTPAQLQQSQLQHQQQQLPHAQLAHQHSGQMEFPVAADYGGDATAVMHGFMTPPTSMPAVKADYREMLQQVQQQHQQEQQHFISMSELRGAEQLGVAELAGQLGTSMPMPVSTSMPGASLQVPGEMHVAEAVPAAAINSSNISLPAHLQQSSLQLSQPAAAAGERMTAHAAQGNGVLAAEQPLMTAIGAPSPIGAGPAAPGQPQQIEAPRGSEPEEVVLLPAEQLVNMEQEKLVGHVKALQEELYAKRELLKRSFDQLRRTQERLGRRERKLAKEQQKCRQYQQALSVWQASMTPMADPAAQELFQTQMQVAMAAQAAAVQQAATAAAVATQQ